MEANHWGLRKSRNATSLNSRFYFSGRRQHTRCYRDWSSDVCSSDLHVELKDYLCTSPEIAKSLPQTLEGYFMQLQIPLADIRCKLVLNEAIVDPPAPHVLSVVLDIRSEERRVGKGSRTGGTTCAYDR